jgi:hypothetical protein
MPSETNSLTATRPRAPLRRWHANARRRAAALIGFTILSLAAEMANAAVDLLQQYPAKLEGGDTAAERARPWQFTTGDIFQITGFTNKMAGNLRVRTGPADVGLGHCADGVVWALVRPRDGGKISSPAANSEENMAHVWLRFHPVLFSRR